MAKLIKRFSRISFAAAAVLATHAACVALAADARATEESLVSLTDAIRACTLVLSSDADMGQWWQCVDSIGDQHPTNDALLKCTSAIRWHSQSDGKSAGLKIAECFRNAAVGTTDPRG
jgi:hypothetical protein